MRTDFVVGGCIVKDNRILLIHHKKSGLWLNPGGHIEKDELPDDAVLREIKEETGLICNIIGLTNENIGGNTHRILANPFHINVHRVSDSNGPHDHCCFFYLCDVIGRQIVSINHDEVYDFKWVSLDELESMDLSTDVKAVSKMALLSQIN